jgi:hypothetical protein
MPHAEPKREEFEVSAGLATHKPTGASWRAGEGAQTARSFKQGSLGRTLANGDDYCPEEVAALAHQLLREAGGSLPRELVAPGDPAEPTGAIER